MFRFLQSPEKKLRHDVKTWLQLAQKVYQFRRDVLPPPQVAELEAQMGGLRALIKRRAGPEELTAAIQQIEAVLGRAGGAIYPKSALAENVEFFLVAAIVILGIRTYFVQPFKIPTNSMWPTYNGLVPEVFRHRAAEPAAITEVARFLALGAQPHRIDAPAGGEVLIPVQGSRDALYVSFQNVPSRTWGLFRTTAKAYTLYVGGEPVAVTVPKDFDFEWVIRDEFFPDHSHEPAAVDLARIIMRAPERLLQAPDGRILLRTGKVVRAGDRVLSFDVLTGDQLLVDRISYHFVWPRAGSGFVFRTGKIPGLAREFGDEYFVKRLVGTPGDVLQVKGFGLYRNGAPITGSEVFGKNAQQEGEYPGYRNSGLLAAGQTVKVPPHEFFAMGDNSPNSDDSRSWGFVPASEVVGRPLFVYYPFTSHWGLAK